jgi:hypothetical protein
MRMNGEGVPIPKATAPDANADSNLEAMSGGVLIKEIAREIQHLVKAQIALARVEVRANVAAEAKTAAGLGIGAVTVLIGVNLLLVTAILGLATVLPGWAAGLIVSGVVLATAATVGVVGWRKRVRRPLVRTRHELEEDVKWTKERVS